MRLLLLLPALFLLTAPNVDAQETVRAACTNGVAEGFPCSNVDLVGHLSRFDLDVPAFQGAPVGNDIWGWTDPDTGIEYALVGVTEGTAFVSLADPTDPTVIGTLASQTFVTTWRDIKTYGTYAYIVSEANSHGMQVFDLTRLRDVTTPPVEFEADAVYQGAGSAHNIVIDEGLPYA
ncbi:MAG: choice-of-anchor B family protein, partial [Bacteroidota bacterium]